MTVTSIMNSVFLFFPNRAVARCFVKGGKEGAVSRVPKAGGLWEGREVWGILLPKISNLGAPKQYSQYY